MSSLLTHLFLVGIHLHRVRTRDEFYNKIDSLRKTGQYE